MRYLLARLLAIMEKPVSVHTPANVGPARRRFGALLSEFLTSNPTRPRLGWSNRAFAFEVKKEPPTVGYWRKGTALPQTEELIEVVVQVLFSNHPGFDEQKHQLKAAWQCAKNEPYKALGQASPIQAEIQMGSNNLGKDLNNLNGLSIEHSKLADLSWVRKLVAHPAMGLTEPDEQFFYQELARHLIEIERDVSLGDLNSSDLLREIGWDFFQLQTRACMKLSEKLLAYSEKLKGVDRKLTLHFLEMHAEAFLDNNDLAGARPLFERIIAITDELYSPPDLLAVSNHRELSKLLLYLEDYTAAKVQIKRAISIAKRKRTKNEFLLEELKNEMGWIKTCMDGQGYSEWMPRSNSKSLGIPGGY